MLLPLLIAILIAVVFIIVTISRFGWHPVFSLLVASLGLGFYFGLDGAAIISTIGNGFGSILSGIGLIVVLGSVIGVALEQSGAAVRIAEAVLDFFGPKRPALAVSVIGALVSIPVFCDSGFILLAGLNRSLARKSGEALGVLSLALAAGLYTTHTLVPPTPGPIAAAGQLGADDYLGTIMLLGGIISIPVIMLAYFLSKKLGNSLVVEEAEGTSAGAELVDNRQVKAMPLWLSFAPLLLPILLIATGTLVKFSGAENILAKTALFFGQPLMSLLVGCLPAYWLSTRIKANFKAWTTKGVQLSGPILIITGAGGAFGAILKASPLQAAIKESLAGGQLSFLVLLLLAFAIAALLKTAQGSSTNALVITASLLAPLATVAGVSGAVQYALLVLAIGGGAMTVSHANDSYFWVVTRFSGIPVGQAYRSYTLLTGLMGLVTLGMVLVLALFIV
ncbi:MAG: GntP family permease [Bacteroidota bacterium]